MSQWEWGGCLKTNQSCCNLDLKATFLAMREYISAIESIQSLVFWFSMTALENQHGIPIAHLTVTELLFVGK